MTFTASRLLAAAAAFALAAPAAHAVTDDYDQDVTNDVIFGGGNVNGAFTTDRANGIELGLRGKLRFNASNAPENTFNSNGDGTYTFQAGAPSGGASWVAATTPIWSFEWSINTDFDGSSGLNLDDLTYELSLDGDPGAGTNFLTFDPINDVNPGTGTVQWDHGIGDNGTGNGGGTRILNGVSDAVGYAGLIAGNNLAQNSWTYEFFNFAATPLENFNPNENGVYTIMLKAFNSGTEVASTSIDVNVVPLPAGALMLISAFGLAGAVRMRAARRG